jgi:hypothetical protein
MSKIITVPLAINEDEAWALAQFVKRVTWSEMRACAQDEAETELIRAGITSLQTALKDAGFAPR